MAPVYAFVITGHGYGHASRQMEVLRVLLERRPDARAVVLTAAPASIFADYLGGLPGVWGRVEIVPCRADVGVVQRDSLALDHAATAAALARTWGDPAAAERALADLLAPHAPSVVIADVPPPAFGAAARLGVPSVAVANFDWAFIYEDVPALAEWGRVCRAWQAQATAAVHLNPGPPLAGFGRVVEAPPVARRAAGDPAATRARLRIPDGHRAVLASFGGFGLEDAGRRIPPVDGVTWLLAPPMPDLSRPDTRWAAGVPYLSLLAAADAVFTKPGYGMCCEAAEHRTRMLYTDRGEFAEYPWLVRWLEENVPCAHLPSAALGDPAAVAGALARLFAAPDRWPERGGGAEVAAGVISSLS